MVGLAVVASLVAMLTAGGAGAANTTPAAIVVTGQAGAMATITVPTTVKLHDASIRSTADRGGWAGVVVVETTGAPLKRHFAVSSTLTEAFRCPGTKCPYTAGGAALFGSQVKGSGPVVLTAGRYHVVLAGPERARVTTKIIPANAGGGAPIRATATGKPAAYRAHAVTAAGAAGREITLHQFDQVAPAGSWGLAARHSPYAVLPAGGLVTARCSTAGANRAQAEAVGGVAPCLDFEGADSIPAPDAGPAGVDAVRSIVPVGVISSGMYGAADEPMSLGIDMAVAGGTASYLRSVFIGVMVR